MFIKDQHLRVVIYDFITPSRLQSSKSNVSVNYYDIVTSTAIIMQNAVQVKTNKSNYFINRVI